MGRRRHALEELYHQRRPRRQEERKTDPKEEVIERAFSEKRNECDGGGQRTANESNCAQHAANTCEHSLSSR